MGIALCLRSSAFRDGHGLRRPGHALLPACDRHRDTSRCPGRIGPQPRCGGGFSLLRRAPLVSVHSCGGSAGRGAAARRRTPCSRSAGGIAASGALPAQPPGKRLLRRHSHRSIQVVLPARVLSRIARANGPSNARSPGRRGLRWPAGAERWPGAGAVSGARNRFGFGLLGPAPGRHIAEQAHGERLRNALCSLGGCRHRSIVCLCNLPARAWLKNCRRPDGRWTSGLVPDHRRRRHRRIKPRLPRRNPTKKASGPARTRCSWYSRSSSASGS